MNQDGKTILKSILIFGLILAAHNILLSILLRFLHFRMGQTNLKESLSGELWIWAQIQIGILMWALIHLSRKLKEFRFWKLIGAAIGIFVLDYHLFYLYDVIDYYVIHESPLEGSDALNQLLSLMENNPPPRYRPYDHFIGSLTAISFLIRIGEYAQGLYLLICGPLTLSLWLSGMIFFIFRKKKVKQKMLVENSLIDE